MKDLKIQEIKYALLMGGEFLPNKLHINSRLILGTPYFFQGWDAMYSYSTINEHKIDLIK